MPAYYRLTIVCPDRILVSSHLTASLFEGGMPIWCKISI